MERFWGVVVWRNNNTPQNENKYAITLKATNLVQAAKQLSLNFTREHPNAQVITLSLDSLQDKERLEC